MWYWRRSFDYVAHSTENWLDTTERSWPARLFGGVCVPAALSVVAVLVFASGRAWFPARGMWAELHGRGAMAVGIACLGAAVFCHGHYFWAPVYRLEIISQLLKLIGAAACAGGMVYVLWALLWGE